MKMKQEFVGSLERQDGLWHVYPLFLDIRPCESLGAAKAILEGLAPWRSSDAALHLDRT